MSISVKILDRASLPAALQVVTRSFSTVAEEFGLTRENCPGSTAFIRLEDLERDYDGGNQMFGLYASEQFASFAELSPKGDEIYMIQRLSTMPPYRHRGYGGALLRHCMDTAAMLGGKAVEVGIIDENVRLKNWYIRHGFIIVGREKHEGLPFTVGRLARSLTV